MNTLHFKYAVEIEKTRSITQAAENLYMAQPNLSKAIKELESTLGITIFKRTSKGVIPTEQGERFLEYAKQILVQIGNMEAIRHPYQNGKRSLRISAPRTGYISAAFASFAADNRKNSELELTFRETSSMSTIENVCDKGYDLGIIRFKASNETYFMDCLTEKKLSCRPLWDFEKLAIMSGNHPCAEKAELSYSELADEYIEIIQGDDAVPYLSAAGAKMSAGQPSAGRCIYVFDRGSALDMLTSADGTFMLDAPMPAEACRNYGLIQRKCSSGGAGYRDMIIYSDKHSLSDTELGFINKLFEIRNTALFSKFS